MFIVCFCCYHVAKKNTGLRLFLSPNSVLNLTSYFTFSRLLLRLSHQTKLCHGSHAAVSHGPAASASTSSSSTPFQRQCEWQRSRYQPGVGLPGEPGQGAGWRATSNGAAHIPEYASTTAPSSASAPAGSSSSSLHTGAPKYVVSPG